MVIKIIEKTYDEVDFTLTIKNKSGKDIPESEFNKFTSLIEEQMSNDDFLVIVSSLDRNESEIKQ